MDNHHTSELVQLEGCGALYSLAANNPSNKATVARLGGVETILRAMSSFVDSPRVQEFGCWALRILVQNQQNQDKIAQSGGIKAVIEACANHGAVVQVQVHGIWALCNLAYGHK